MALTNGKAMQIFSVMRGKSFLVPPSNFIEERSGGDEFSHLAFLVFVIALLVTI
jgi:hypothetical protein